MDGCTRRHHPSLHLAPQGSIQAVKSMGHSTENPSELVPGVEVVNNMSARNPGKFGPQGKFVKKVRGKSTLTEKISWVDSTWLGGSSVRLEEIRAEELNQMEELLKVPPVEGGNVLSSWFCHR